MFRNWGWVFVSIGLIGGLACRLLMMSGEDGTPTPLTLTSPAPLLSPEAPLAPTVSAAESLVATIDPETCEATLQAVLSLPGRSQLPSALSENVYQDLAEGRVKGFDVNAYFTALPHLSPAEGYVLDSVYVLKGGAGEPLLYARLSGEAPYRTYEEFLAARYPGGVPSGVDIEHEFLNSIQTGDTPEGYFEFVVLAIMANQYYQYWHAAYNDAAIVCGRAHWGRMSAGDEGSPFALPRELKEQASQLDFTPRIEMKEESVLVQVVIFTHWGGWIRSSYTIRRSFPHTILDRGRETLIEYDCGIRF